MKRLTYTAFIAFLASVATIAALSRLSPENAREAPAAEREITLAELARHASAEDCWLAIDGGVYDVGGYAPSHPAPPEVLTVWCGREATEAFNTKGVGRPHGDAAREMLESFRVGKLRR